MNLEFDISPSLAARELLGVPIVVPSAQVLHVCTSTMFGVLAWVLGIPTQVLMIVQASTH